MLFRSEIIKRIESSENEKLKIYFLDGNYFFDSVLKINNISNKKSVEFSALNPGKVSFTGMKKLKNWKKVKNNSSLLKDNPELKNKKIGRASCRERVEVLV